MVINRVLRRLDLLPLLVLLTLCVIGPVAIVKADSRWQVVSIVDIGSAINAPGCKNSVFLKGIPDLSGQQITSIDLKFDPSVSVFRGERRPVIKVTEIVNSNAEAIRSQFAGIVASKVPKDSCDSISAGEIGYSIEGRALVAAFDVHYQKRACTDSTCFKGWGKAWIFPYPIFEHCVAKVDLPGASATLAVRTVMTPRLQMLPGGFANISIQSVPTATVKDGPSELMKNIVGVLTLGIGSKAIQDEFEHQVSDFRGSLNTESRSIAIVKLPQARDDEVEINFLPEQPYFTQSPTLGLATSRTTSVQPSVALTIRQQAVQAQKFFGSCTNPQREYVVQSNDSLWKIAEQVYGEGQYYHLLERGNAFGTAGPSSLQPGQKLAVTPLFDIDDQNEVIVSSGDSLWKIAKEKLGNPLLYTELEKKNHGEIADPQKLSTLTTVKIK